MCGVRVLRSPGIRKRKEGGEEGVKKTTTRLPHYSLTTFFDTLSVLLSLHTQTPAPRPAGPPGAHRAASANNKKKNKSKAQRKQEQQSREGKKLDKEAAAEVERRKRDPSDPNNTLILNYSRWEGDRRRQLDGKGAAAATKKSVRE